MLQHFARRESPSPIDFHLHANVLHLHQLKGMCLVISFPTCLIHVLCVHTHSHTVYINHGHLIIQNYSFPMILLLPGKNKYIARERDMHELEKEKQHLIGSPIYFLSYRCVHFS